MDRFEECLYVEVDFTLRMLTEQLYLHLLDHIDGVLTAIHSGDRPLTKTVAPNPPQITLRATLNIEATFLIDVPCLWAKPGIRPNYPSELRGECRILPSRGL